MRVRPGPLLLALLISACAAPVSLDPAAGPADPAAGPADPAAEMRPDLLVVDPATARPGEIVALGFPQETTRGVLFVLEQRMGDAWVHRFSLTSDGPGPGWRMTWHAAGADGLAVEDIGVGGPGPDRVTVPEPAEPGEYRICTGNAGENFCAPIEIVAP